MTDERDFVVEHIRERLRRLASQQDMLTCEHMLEGADEIERLQAERDLWKERTEQGSLIIEGNVAEIKRLELLAVNRLIEIDRLKAALDGVQESTDLDDAHGIARRALENKP